MRPLLSIAIPTFNRSRFLGILLSELQEQLEEVANGSVEVLIGDNGSEDNTDSIVNSYVNRIYGLTYFRRTSNLGPDSNISKLVASASGDYCWVLGDDDLPRRGLLLSILDYIDTNQPTLLYLTSKWGPNARSLSKDYAPISRLSVELMPAVCYAKAVNVWTTFISAWVFSLTQFYENVGGREALSENIATEINQLSWILPLMQLNQAKLAFASPDSPCILATSGNTGGYSIIRVFAVNYPSLVRSSMPGNDALYRALVSPYLRDYLPQLIFQVRFGDIFRDPKAYDLCLIDSIKYLYRFPAFWLLSFPLIVIPRWLIRLFPLGRSIISLVTRSLAR